MTRRIGRLHSEQRGIALVVVMAMLVVLGVIATAVLTNALHVKNATASERASKQAYAAAVNGLRSAMFWLNAAIPADNGCPPLPGQTTAQAPNGTSGVCGPYESDNISGAAGVAQQPTVNQRFTYWITPVLNPSTDTCTGNTPVTARLGVTIRDRCITALGESLLGTKVTSTKRVQARVTTTNALFPVPGIFGGACLSVGVSAHAGAVDCDSGSGVSNSDYYGTLGSNGTVNAQLKTWNYDPSTTDPIQKLSPAALYLGYTSPTSSTLPSYSIKLQTVPAPFITPTSCGGGQTFCNGSEPPLPYNSSASGPYQNPVHLFGRWYQPFRMGDLFRTPPPMVLAGHSLLTCATAATTDVAVCNNNSQITAAQGTPSGCATLSATRVLSVATDCVLKIPNGTYDFCGIVFGSKGGAVLPADATADAEVRIFLDNQNRTVATTPATSACGNTSGTINWGGSGNKVSRWMTNNNTNVTAQACLNAFNVDPWSALGGQLYVYGGGDPTVDPVNNYPATTSASFDIPDINFNGSVIATNSTLNLTASNTCVNGAIAAGAVNIANSAGFKWDPKVDLAHLSQNSNTFYRTAFSTCGTAGFRFDDASTPPTYPTYPSDGC